MIRQAGRELTDDHAENLTSGRGPGAGKGGRGSGSHWRTWTVRAILDVKSAAGDRSGLAAWKIWCTHCRRTGFAMRFEAVILPDLGTGPDVPIVVSHWYAARGEEVWEG